MRWIDTLDPDAIRDLYANNRHSQIPAFVWQHDGWHIIFWPWPKSPLLRGRRGVRPIGTKMPEGEWLSTHMAIKDAIEAKAKKYGDLSLPLLVALNVVEDGCDA